MTVTAKQKHWLRGQAHHLKPVVTLGQAGLTDAVLAELEIALDHHELLKVKVGGGDRDERDVTVEMIAQRTGSEMIQRIGNTATFYRTNPRKKAPLEVPRL